MVDLYRHVSGSAPHYCKSCPPTCLSWLTLTFVCACVCVCVCVHMTNVFCVLSVKQDSSWWVVCMACRRIQFTVYVFILVWVYVQTQVQMHTAAALTKYPHSEKSHDPPPTLTPWVVSQHTLCWGLKGIKRDFPSLSLSLSRFLSLLHSCNMLIFFTLNYKTLLSSFTTSKRPIDSFTESLTHKLTLHSYISINSKHKAHPKIVPVDFLNACSWTCCERFIGACYFKKYLLFSSFQLMLFNVKVPLLQFFEYPLSCSVQYSCF